MTARVLSEYFDQVLAIDRDDIEDGPVVHKSVSAIIFMRSYRVV
jgi:hypothetical protein